MEIKGVAHVHSTHSYDGKLTLSQLKSFLSERGISFCCMTEHTDFMDRTKAAAFVDECKALSDDKFIFIPGFEVPYKNLHMLFIDSENFVSSVANSAQLVLWKKETGLTVLAHPVRNKFRIEKELEQLLDGVEVWNQQYEGKAVPRRHSLRLLRELKTRNTNLRSFCGLDLHRKEHFGAPLIMVEAAQFSREDIIRALKDSNYTFGNEIVRVDAEGNVRGISPLFSFLRSAYAITLITTGKYINKTLATLGLRLPKSLLQQIRSRV